MKKICLCALCALTIVFTGCSKKPSVPKDPAAEQRTEYLRTCLNEAQSRLNHDRSFDPSAMSMDVINTPTGAKAVIPFEIKNAFGVTLKRTLYCEFEGTRLKNIYAR